MQNYMYSIHRGKLSINMNRQTAVYVTRPNKVISIEGSP